MARYNRVRLFQHDGLEQLTLMPPFIFAAVWLGVLVLAARAVFAEPAVSPAAALGLTAAGLMLWTLFEYLSHRFLFHLRPRSTFGRRLIFLVHENHHVDPADPYRNIMPLGVSLSLAALFWALFHVVCGTAAPAMFLGFAGGYVLYDATHYACHQIRLPGRLLGGLKRHHLLHHHAGRDANYAITAILWDRLFGTAFAPGISGRTAGRTRRSSRRWSERT